MQLTLPSYAARSHYRAGAKRGETAGMFGNQYVIDWRPWQDCRDLCSRAGVTRQVLRAMDCDINISSEKRSLDFRRKQAFSTSVEVDNFGVITACNYDFGLKCDTRIRASNCLLNQQSLCTRKLAAPRAEGYLGNHCGNVTRDTLQVEAVALQLRSAERIFAEGGMLSRLRETIQP